jgi:hypothetical protein
MNHLCSLVNSVLTFSYFPGRWKMAVAVILLKTPRMASEPHNYRHFGLLSAVGKIAEAVIII